MLTARKSAQMTVEYQQEPASPVISQSVDVSVDVVELEVNSHCVRHDDLPDFALDSHSGQQRGNCANGIRQARVADFEC